MGAIPTHYIPCQQNGVIKKIGNKLNRKRVIKKIGNKLNRKHKGGCIGGQSVTDSSLKVEQVLEKC